MKISILIATFDRSQSLKKTLESIAGSSLIGPHELEIIVVDNNSSDGTRSVVDHFSKSTKFAVKYIFENRQGKTYALNTGLAKADSDIIVFTDDDITFDQGWLSAIIRNFESGSIDGVTGRILPECDIPKVSWYSDKLSSVIGRVDYSKERVATTQVTGANMAFRREVLERLGGFDIHLGMINEDSFLNKKLHEHNFRIFYDPAMLVYHHFDPARFTKSYFRKWYWLSGVSLAEINRDEDLKVSKRFLGLPFWKYREILESLSGFLANIFNAKLRFYHELWLRRRIGYCWQRWKSAKEKGHA